LGDAATNKNDVSGSAAVPGGSSYLPSGNLLHFANLTMAVEIADLPVENGDFPSIYSGFTP